MSHRILDWERDKAILTKRKRALEKIKGAPAYPVKINISSLYFSVFPVIKQLNNLSPAHFGIRLPRTARTSAS